MNNDGVSLEQQLAKEYKASTKEKKKMAIVLPHFLIYILYAQHS